MLKMSESKNVKNARTRLPKMSEGLSVKMLTGMHACKVVGLGCLGWTLAAVTGGVYAGQRSALPEKRQGRSAALPPS